MLCTTKSVLATKSHNIELLYKLNMCFRQKILFSFTDRCMIPSLSHTPWKALHVCNTHNSTKTQIKKRMTRMRLYLHCKPEIHYTVIDSDQLS